MAAPTVDTTATGTSGATGTTGDLESLGYKQELHRALGPFASFCSGFSFVSILTTVFQLFALGFAFGGPAFFWTWPIVFIGQYAVCLIFAELAARYPIAGAVWFMQIGYIVSVAAIAIAMQAVLPAIWDGFQLVGGDSSITSASGALNAIVLGSITIAICGVISAMGVTKMAAITRIGVTLEIIGVVVLLVVLFANAERGPSVVFETNGVQGDGLYFWPFLASMIMAAYVMYGFDSAAELSEETNDPRRTAPRAITQCMLVSAVGGGLLILGALMAAPDILAPELATQGVAYIITAQAGDVAGKIILAAVAVAVFSAALAIQASASRVMFSMARDGRLPFAKALAKVSKRTSTPLWPGITVSVLSIGVLLLNLGQTGLFAAVTSVSVVVVYVAYLLVTVPLLVQRLRKHPEHSEVTHAYFTLGRWGLPINIVAVVFGVLMLVNIGWPRAAVYDPAGGNWVLRYSAPLFVAGILVVGAIAYPMVKRQKIPAET